MLYLIDFRGFISPNLFCGKCHRVEGIGYDYVVRGWDDLARMFWQSEAELISKISSPRVAEIIAVKTGYRPAVGDGKDFDTQPGDTVWVVLEAEEGDAEVAQIHFK